MKLCGLRGICVSCWLLAAICPSISLATTILSKYDMRLWETVVDRNMPLSWPWEDGADSATLHFYDRLTRTAWSVSVSRAAGEMRGSCAQPVRDSTTKALVDITLVQKAGEEIISEETATLAYVSGANGGPITVRAMGTREWDRIRKARVIVREDDSGYETRKPNNTGFTISIR